MPSASSGTTVTTTAQIADDVIVNADINSAAAIAYSKLDLALGIVNADVSASAAIVDTKLAQIATASKVSGAALTSLASIPAGAGVIPAVNLPASVIRRGSSGTSVQVVNTTTETNLFSITIPANSIGTAGYIHVKIWCADMNSVAGSAYCNLKVKYGGTAVIPGIDQAPQINGNGRGWIDAYIFGDGTTSSQEGFLEWTNSATQAASTAPRWRLVDAGTAAIDSTAAQTLLASITWSVASASNGFTMGAYLVETVYVA